MSRTVKRSTRLATVAGLVAAVGAGMIVTAPASQAAPVAAFRLSNFSATIANICVHTDIATQCSGNMAAGKSEVWKVAYKGPRKWYCTATAKGLTGTASTLTSAVTTSRNARRSATYSEPASSSSKQEPGAPAPPR